MKITRKSPLTGVVTTLDLPITEEQLRAYENGVFVQHAFPSLSSEEREFILTGYTPADWQKMFPPEE